MKKLVILAMLFCMLPFVSLAQTVNDIPVKDIDVEYIQIVGTSKFMSNKVSIKIDFGQENKYITFDTSQQTEIKDSEGNPVEFNSMIDALNFMSKLGYEFIQAYAISDRNQNVYHYLLKKR